MEYVALRQPVVVRKKTSLWHHLLRQWDLQVMVLPGIILLLVFSYLPMWGVLAAFQDYDLSRGFFGSPWIGFKHFAEVFSDPLFLPVLKNTVAISALRLIFAFPAPVFLALLLNEVQWPFFKRIVQTISYLPHFMSWVIVSGLVISSLAVDNGSVNMALLQMHVIHEPVNWLSTPEYFWSILISTGIWKEIGFGSIIYLAAIAGVDPNLYEAADIDGAGRLRRLWYVTLPGIAPVVTIFLILSVGQILNAGFEDILLLTNRGDNAILRDVSDVIDTYVYRVGLTDFRYSYGVAVGLFKSVVNVFMLVCANFMARRWGETSLW
ncbi:ABC transporter permease [Dictyobacter alpinus]